MNSKGVMSRHDIRYIHFAATGFGTLGGYAAALLTELAK
jgi:type IV secretory pathway TrbL component